MRVMTGALLVAMLLGGCKRADEPPCLTLEEWPVGAAREGEPCVGSCPANGEACAFTGVTPPDGGGAGAGLCYAADGVYCDAPTQTCAQLTPRGEACATSHACAAGFCSAGICAAPFGLGNACTEHAGCHEAFYCGSDSKCAARRFEDEPCVANVECSSNLCHAGTCTVACEESSH